jgi:hypothetical protein
MNMTAFNTKRMSNGFSLFLPLIPAFALVAAPLCAATPDLPAPEALLQRHIEALGGDAALRKAQSLSFKGEVNLSFLKAKAPIEFLFQAPDRFYCLFRYHHAFFGFLKVPFFAKRQAECGYDGTNGWLVDFERKVEPLYGTDEAFMRGLLDKFSPLCFSRKFTLTRTLDVVKFADRDCYRVLLVYPFGEHAFEFYDVKSGLLAGTVYPYDTDNAMVKIRTIYSDFRRLGGGLQLPFQLEVAVGDQHYSIQASEIRTDLAGARVPPSKFKSAPPALAMLKPSTIPAREVIDKYVEACGGSATLRKHSSLKLTGTYQTPGSHGFTNQIEILSAVTNLSYLNLPTPNGHYQEGYDGEHYWRVDGKEIKFAAGSDLAQKLAERQFLAELHAPESFRSLDNLGTVKLDDHECYELLLVRQDGEVFEEFYDVQTSFLRARHTTDERFDGTLKLLANFDDFHRFGDWLLPARQSYKLMGDPQVLTITNAEWDTVPATAFDMPADVKARLPLKQ